MKGTILGIPLNAIIDVVTFLHNQINFTGISIQKLLCPRDIWRLSHHPRFSLAIGPSIMERYIFSNPEIEPIVSTVLMDQFLAFDRFLLLFSSSSCSILQ
jgi:hypothetical protein